MENKTLIIKSGSITAAEKKKLISKGYDVITVKDEKGINFLSESPRQDYVFENCLTCGDRIYLTKERLTALKRGNEKYYCPKGHSQWFVKPK